MVFAGFVSLSSSALVCDLLPRRLKLSFRKVHCQKSISVTMLGGHPGCIMPFLAPLLSGAMFLGSKGDSWLDCWNLLVRGHGLAHKHCKLFLLTRVSDWLMITFITRFRFKFIVSKLWQLVVFCTCRILPLGLRFVVNFPLLCTLKTTSSRFLLEILGSTKWFHLANSGLFRIPRWNSLNIEGCTQTDCWHTHMTLHLTLHYTNTFTHTHLPPPKPHSRITYVVHQT